MLLWIIEVWKHDEGDDDDDDDDHHHDEGVGCFVVWKDEGEVRRTSRLNEWFN